MGEKKPTTHKDIADMLREGADLIESGNTCWKVSDTLDSIKNWVIQEESRKQTGVSNLN